MTVVSLDERRAQRDRERLDALAVRLGDMVKRALTDYVVARLMEMEENDAEHE